MLTKNYMERVMLSKTTLVPKTYHGWESCQKIAEIIQPLNVKNILIIADPFLYTSGMLSRLTDYLSDYTLNIFHEIEPEPSLELAEKIVEYARQSKTDLVIGIGGGSALDLAKLAAVIASHDGKVADYLNLTGTRALTHSGLPKIMIPTTSGTGSEVTNISVVSLATSKDVIANDYLLPNIALLDPSLTVSVPPKVTAATGMDALTHAIEAYLSVNSDPITDQLALSAIRMIMSSLPKAYSDPNDQKARADMSYGSYLAGVAFFNAGAGGVHALAYPLGGQFHISHGESNAVLLPFVLDHIKESCHKKLQDIGMAMNLAVQSMESEQAAKETINAIQSLIKRINIPTSLQDFGIKKEHLNGLAEDGIKQKRLLARSPKPLLQEDILSIYTTAWGE